MMKKLFLVAALLMTTVALKAQSIIETVATVGDLTVPAVTVSLDKEVKTVQGAMTQYLKELKLKTSKEDGYTVARNAFVEVISSSPINLFTKVEEQGKKKNRATVVTVCALSTDLTVDQNTLKANTSRWLNGFISYIDRYEAQQQMAVEQGNLKKAESVAAKAAASAAAIDKSIASDQQKIEDKKAKIAKLQKEIKDLEKEISVLEQNIERSGSKLEDANRKAEEAQQKVQGTQGEVERYRQMAQ